MVMRKHMNSMAVYKFDMLKGILLLISTLAIVSCDVNFSEEEMKESRERSFAQYVKKIDYEGHTYLVYHTLDPGWGLCHDENCKCKTNQQ